MGDSDIQPLHAEAETGRRTRVPLVLGGLLVLSFLLWLFHLWLISPPPGNYERRVEITSGQSVRDITATVKEAGVVRSELWLYIVLTYGHDPTKIFAGTYVFTDDDDLYAVATKLSENAIESELTRLTFPEGIRVSEMAAIAATTLEDFAISEYESLTAAKEGYLWPDTYFVPIQFSAEDLVLLQMDTFRDNLEPLQSQFDSSSFSEYEVITLASIIEREANDRTSMRMVSGVLQNRLAIDMPLQADASIEYVLAEPLNELPPGALAVALKENESPYNTYKTVGLPPTPIGNPGLDSIEAVLDPAIHDYLYYITGSDGEFYYASTLAEHNRNIELYLRP